MSELEARIRQRLKLTSPDSNGKLPEMPTRWPAIQRHYEQRIRQGMKLAYAVDQAFCNLSGSNRHDAVRGSTDSIGQYSTDSVGDLS